MKRNYKTIVSLSALLAVLGSTLSACGGGAASGGQPAAANGTDAKPAAPTDISVMTTFFTQEPPGPDNVVVKEVEKKTNTKLKIQWVSPNNYDDKTNVTLASGDIPDLMLSLNPSSSVVVNMEQQGAFWDLTPLIKDYPHLKAFPDVAWTFTKAPDGKNYAIPRVRPADGAELFMYRKDWADKLGLKAPQTLDDIYQMLKAFKEKDPDGNGKDDTYGYVGTLAFAEKAMNNGPGWKEVDGKLVPPEFLPGTREALLFEKKLYAEKLIPADYSLLKNSQVRDLMTTSKAGALQEGLATSWDLTNEIRKTNPQADLVAMPYIETPAGKYALKSNSYYGGYLIPKKVPLEKAKKILAFMDYGATDEGSDLAWYGLPNVHYTEKDGVKFTNEQAKKDIVAQQAFGQIFGKFDKYQRAYAANIPPEIYARNRKIIDDSEKVSSAEPRGGLISETNNKFGAEIDKKTNDLKTKIAMGTEPISAWDDYVTKLKNDPNFQKIIQEYNDAYQKRKNAK